MVAIAVLFKGDMAPLNKRRGLLICSVQPRLRDSQGLSEATGQNVPMMKGRRDGFPDYCGFSNVQTRTSLEWLQVNNTAASMSDWFRREMPSSNPADTSLTMNYKHRFLFERLQNAPRISKDCEVSSVSHRCTSY